MDKNRLNKLDSMFETFSIISEGSYIYLCDMKMNYSRWSRSAVDYFNLPDRYMYNAGTIWEECIHPDDRESYRRSIENIFSGNDNGHDMQYRAKASDGSYVVCTCRGAVIRDENGVPEYFAGAIKNHGSLSYIDTITGLRSLYGFFDDIKTILWKKKKSSVIITGINGFSVINDMYGYKFGNKVLRNFANLIQKVFANYGSVYRMDGTKFAIISSTPDEKHITELYHELRKAVLNDFHVDSEKISLSLNAGLMVMKDFNIESETIYSCLKYIYYESKNRRLGDMVVFENIQNAGNRNTIETLNVIRSSVVENCKGFFLCYQPIMYADTEKLKGMEALIRWKNDKYGIIPPVQFVPVLEQDVLFPELGRWILKQAMTDGKKFLNKYPDFVMNVNISYAQLEKGDFVADVFSILNETGFPPENLCLEITERCRLLDIETLNNMFRIFKEHGIKIALDDFGTGFSSLGILRNLPIDTVKIDREFVKDIENSQSDQSTVQFISTLADAFKAEVCVEGVETSDMRDFLRQYGIKSFQGYYYSRPVPADEIISKNF
ncbi:MAG: GGDEF and EAL domain-containing protein [Ruminococcus sp.]|nr:GGDEF and EAL domain-containing protein [Ruminococcus sp.]